MEPYIIIGIFVLVAAIAIVFVQKNKKKASISKDDVKHELSVAGKGAIAANSNRELTVKFEYLPALTESEETALVEIKDKKLLARIDNAVPGTLQAMANAVAVHQYQNAVQNLGQLYQAVIPQGAVLADSVM